MLGQLAKATINSMVYSILTKMSTILEDENLSEEVTYFLDTFNSLYAEDKDDEEILFIINVLSEEFNGGNDMYYKDNYIQTLVNDLTELGFGVDTDNYFLTEVKKAYENRAIE